MEEGKRRLLQKVILPVQQLFLEILTWRLDADQERSGQGEEVASMEAKGGFVNCKIGR